MFLLADRAVRMTGYFIDHIFCKMIAAGWMSCSSFKSNSGTYLFSRRAVYENTSLWEVLALELPINFRCSIYVLVKPGNPTVPISSITTGKVYYQRTFRHVHGYWSIKYRSVIKKITVIAFLNKKTYMLTRASKEERRTLCLTNTFQWLRLKIMPTDN